MHKYIGQPVWWVSTMSPLGSQERLSFLFNDFSRHTGSSLMARLWLTAVWELWPGIYHHHPWIGRFKWWHRSFLLRYLTFCSFPLGFYVVHCASVRPTDGLQFCIATSVPLGCCATQSMLSASFLCSISFPFNNSKITSLVLLLPLLLQS